MEKLIISLISIGLAALGIVWFLKTSSRKYLNYFKKIRGVNNFFFWLILSNIFFFIYASVQFLTYNLVIVKSGAEPMGGSAGGYLVSESLSIKYFELEFYIFLSTLIINFLIFIFGYFFKNKYILQQQVPENKLNPIHSFGLIIISLTTSFISLISLVLLLELRVSYGG